MRLDAWRTLVMIPMLLLGACVAGTARNAPARPAYGGPDVERPRIAALLDRFHGAASRADMEGYLACLGPESVFLGTDASERWSVAQFREYCRPYFAKGQGWTYTPRERHITFVYEASQRVAVASGASLYPVAYFDELLTNEKYGVCRGTGVVVGDGAGGWHIAQYALALAVPNGAAREVVDVIRREAGGAPH